ncbi:ABC transporter transmembrane domain-containing protein [Vibrio inusitatus]|uniref:ABC transporter transmembrane domain-containing protein n=1 Tax=Vibrio inusitatus TaxID=413402 RepID=UPI0011440BBD|nr:ABC transporter transmembrane domain-containing protein [Vibrio inusitatus]
MSNHISALQSKTKTIVRVIPSSLLINLLSLAIPLVVLQIYDRILPNQSYGTAFLLIAGASIAILLDAFLRYVRTWMLGAAAVNTEHATYQVIVDKLNQATSKQIKQLSPGALQESLKGVGLIKDFYSGGFVSGLIDVPFAIIFLLLVSYVGGSLVFVPIVVWAITFAFVWLFTQKSSEHAKNAAYSEQDRMNFLIIAFSFLDGIKKQAVESKAFQRFRALNKSRTLSLAESERKVAVAQELIQIAAMGTSVAVVLIGSLSVLDGSLTTGGLAACSILSGRAVAPLSALMGLRLKYSSFMVANESLTQLIDNLKRDQIDIQPLPFYESLIAEDVEFERFQQKYHYSFALSKGQMLNFAHSELDIAGHASTVIAGNEQPTNGVFKWNDEVVDNEHYAWRRQFSYVPANPELISGSLIDNVCGFDKSRLEEAHLLADALGLNKIVSELAEGMETKIGFQLGTKLSRGAIKLVGLTAQLAKSTPIVVLDHPEKDLDIDAVNRLKSVIAYYLSKGRTFIINTENTALLELSNQTINISEVEHVS